MPHEFGMLEYSCRNAKALAEFWSTILGLPVDEGASEDYAQLSPPSPLPKWLFVRREPHGNAKSVIVAISSDNLDQSVKLAIEAGATERGRRDEDGFKWAELSDPEGNDFTFNLPPPK